MLITFFYFVCAAKMSLYWYVSASYQIEAGIAQSVSWLGCGVDDAGLEYRYAQEICIFSRIFTPAFRLFRLLFPQRQNGLGILSHSIHWQNNYFLRISRLIWQCLGICLCQQAPTLAAFPLFFAINHLYHTTSFTIAFWHAERIRLWRTFWHCLYF